MSPTRVSWSRNQVTKVHTRVAKPLRESLHPWPTAINTGRCGVWRAAPIAYPAQRLGMSTTLEPPTQ